MQIPFEYGGLVIMIMFALIGTLIVLTCWGACVVADQLERSRQASEKARRELLDMAKNRAASVFNERFEITVGTPTEAKKAARMSPKISFKVRQ